MNISVSTITLNDLSGRCREIFGSLLDPSFPISILVLHLSEVHHRCERLEIGKAGLGRKAEETRKVEERNIQVIASRKASHLFLHKFTLHNPDHHCHLSFIQV